MSEWFSLIVIFSFSFFIGDTSSTSRLDVPSFPHHSLPETPSYPLPRKASFPRVSRRIPQHYRVPNSVTSNSLLPPTSPGFATYQAGPFPQGITTRHSRTCDFCLYEGTGNFTSYDFPRNYRPGLNCTYRIVRPRGVCFLDVRFLVFDIEFSSNCVKDYLEFAGRRHCGKKQPFQSVRVPFPSGEKELVFRFRTDDYGSGEGFWIEVTPVPGSCGGYDTSEDTDGRTVGCSRISADIEGTLEATSADNDSTRPCFLSVKRRDGYCGLRLDWERFNFPERELSLCQRGYFQIPGTTGTRKYCGQEQSLLPVFILFRHNEELLLEYQLPKTEEVGYNSWWNTAEGGNYGFRLKYQQTPCDYIGGRDVGSSGPTSTECDASFFDVSFVLTSPGFPRPISEKAHCRYVIHRASPEVCQLELTFRHFDLPMSRGCVKDFLEVRRQRLCGPQQAFTILDFRDEDKLVLEFVSDGYGDPSRFKISVRQIPCQTITMPDLTSTPSYPSSGRYPGSHIEDETQCSKQIKEPTFEIASPNYPRPYPPNLNCEYSVVAMSAWGICYLDIEFLADLDFGTSNNCEQDFLAINGEKFCDHQPSGATRRFEFREGIKYINFVSDYTGAGSGFYIRGKQVPCGATCDEVIKQNQFSIVSPSYPRPYKNEMECTYFIKRMPGMCGIKLRFHAFDIERSEGCRGDYLKVGLERFCGQMSGLERELSFDGQDMVPIRFHSDGYGTASGFQIDGTQQQCADLSYPPLTSTTTHRSTSPVWPTFPETVPTQWRPPLRPSTAGPPDPTKPPVRCNTVHTDLRGSIQSVDYPEPYPCGLGCIHIIHRIAGYCSVEFQVTDLDIEESDRCFFDWLMIGKERLCGKQSGKTIVVPFTLQTMELKFKSDFYNSGRGYQLEYIQRPCSDAAGEGERILTTTPYPLLGGGITSLGGDPESNESAPPLCTYCLTETIGKLESYGYPSQYRNNLQCSYVFEFPLGYCSATIFFNVFRLEESLGCIKDFLIIDGQRYCGYSLQDTQVETRGNLTFVTDFEGTGEGFSAGYQMHICKGTGGFDPHVTPNFLFGGGDQQSVYELSSKRRRAVESERSLPVQGCPDPVQWNDVDKFWEFLLTPNGESKQCEFKFDLEEKSCGVQLEYVAFHAPSDIQGKCSGNFIRVEGTKVCGDRSGESEVFLVPRTRRYLQIQISSDGSRQYHFQFKSYFEGCS